MRTGLVLSGGGARAFMHLGVIKALEENNIRIDRISATSAGAVAGALYAYGFTPDECLSLLVQTEYLFSVRYAFRGNGLFRIARMEDFFLKYIPENDFSALRIPLLITATDLVRGEAVIFRQGELLKPMLASCCLPGIFEAFPYHGRQLADGGILNNMPVEALENEVDYIIGAHCNPFALHRPLKSTREVLFRTLLLAVHHNNMERLRKCHLLLEPPGMREFGIFDFRKARTIFEVGYRYTHTVLAENEIPEIPEKGYQQK